MHELEPIHEETYKNRNTKLQVPRAIKHRGTVIIILIVLILFIAGILGAWISGYIKAKQASQDTIDEKTAKIQELEDLIQWMEENPYVVEPVTPEINLAVVKSQMNDIKELVVTEYVFTDFERFTDTKKVKGWSLPGTKKSFSMKWDGIIKAGIDLNDLEMVPDTKAKKIYITIPAAKITSYSILSDSIEILDESKNIFNPITVSDKISFDSSTEEKMRNRAIENGILEKAQVQAQFVIRDFLYSIPDIKSFYELEFKLSPQ